MLLISKRWLVDYLENFVYKFIHSNSNQAVVFVSGMGLDIREQREVFIRNMALKQHVSYLALDCNQMASTGEHLPSLVNHCQKIIQEKLPEKNLFFMGFCFGANVALRLANQFCDETRNVVLSSPLVDYSNPSIFETKEFNRKNKILTAHPQLAEEFQKLLLLKQLIDFYMPDLKPEPQQYSGPIQIIHPQKDRFVPVGNSEQMARCLNRENVELSVIPNETHTLKNDFQLRIPTTLLIKALEKCRAD